MTKSYAQIIVLGLNPIGFNEDVWKIISVDVRGADTKLSSCHMALMALMKGITANKFLMKWTENNHFTKEVIHEIMEIFSDAFQCLGVANFETCYRRREAMRPSVPKDHVYSMHRLFRTPTV